MSSNNTSRFYHHFMPKTMPCVVLPSVTSPMLSSTSSPSNSCNDHILNLSASLSKHCPVSNSVKTIENKDFSKKSQNNNTCYKLQHSGEISPLPEPSISSSSSPSSVESEEDEDSSKSNNARKFAGTKVDMNCNDVKGKGSSGDDGGDMEGNECNSVISEHSRFDDDVEERDEHLTEIDVDDSCSSTKCEDSQDGIVLHSNLKHDKNDVKKSKSLAFGIDRILSFSREDDKDQKSPPPPSSTTSPPVVSTNTSSKLANSTDASKVDKCDSSKHHHQQQSYHHHHNHHSILSKLKLCASLPAAAAAAVVTSENQRRLPSGGLSSYFHPTYGPFHHHHHHVNSLITSTSGGGIHNLNSHHNHHHHHNHPQHHPLSHCSECVFLRRHGSSASAASGISNARVNSNSIPSSSSSSANNVATNNMQFSSSMATPCGPTSSAISASFTWMANPSIYDNSAIISPVAGYNQHIPLQPSFGISTSGFSTLATMQQCGTGGTSGRRKRSWSRAVFSNLQRKGLEKRFQIQKYITKPDRRQLAATLGLTDAQVKVWFQNRRMKWRHSKEGKVSSGTGEPAVTPSSSPVTSTTSSKMDGAIKDKK